MAPSSTPTASGGYQNLPRPSKPLERSNILLREQLRQLEGPVTYHRTSSTIIGQSTRLCPSCTLPNRIYIPYKPYQNHRQNERRFGRRHVVLLPSLCDLLRLFLDMIYAPVTHPIRYYGVFLNVDVLGNLLSVLSGKKQPWTVAGGCG